MPLLSSTSIGTVVANDLKWHKAMLVLAYLRDSSDGQDAIRGAAALTYFAGQFGYEITCNYIENASGNQTQWTELQRLIDDSGPGDMLLVESIDRLSWVPAKDWRRLREEIEAKGLRVVSTDLPTSHIGLTDTQGDEFTIQRLDAINSMMLDMVETIDREGYVARRHRQDEDTTKAEEVDAGQPPYRSMRQRIADGLAALCQ